MTAATTAAVNVCVAVVPLQQSRERGQAAQWAVTAWTTGGNVPELKVQLQATPASAGTPLFTFGCGSGDGESVCDLGAVDATSAKRELQAQVTVPVTAATVASVSLKATGSAANLRTDPAAAAAMTILTPPTPFGASATLLGGTVPGVTTSTLNPTLSPGGNASSLFPTLAPQSPDPRAAGTANTRQVANSTALPAGSSTLGAQVAGLVTLALAGVFALTRISIRRPAPAAAADTAAAAPPPEAAAESAEELEGPADPPADPA
ncbi:MAG: hypothetical protein ACRDNO_17705 [Trebonia sp.]